MKIACVVGARPNFVKIAPLWRELKKISTFEPILVHTGQHYDDNLSKKLFQDLELPEPDINLNAKSSDVAELAISCFSYLNVERPTAVLVFGDVNSSVAAASAAYNLKIPVAHVEAGLRSFDETMPEEINRINIDNISDLYFATEIEAVRNLFNEGYPAEKVHFVGNLMIDSLFENLPKAKKLPENTAPFALLTIHRESNTNERSLAELMNKICQIADKIRVIFPVHPRTAKVLKTLHIHHSNIWLSEPLSYLGFLGLMARARFVMTDSGGIQDETTALGIPCLTLRENTERPCTLAGTNQLVGRDPVPAALEILNGYRRLQATPLLWDGKTAPRIVKVLESWI